MDYIHNCYNLRGISKNYGNYYLVEFDKKKPRNIPTLGANGFLIRKKFLEKSQHEPSKFFHIDINVDLIKHGYNKYAFIKSDIVHLTNSRFLNYLNRRKQFVDQYYLNNFSSRRYSVYCFPEDALGLLLFILYATTFIRPLIDSIRGWLKIRDVAWFVHPFVCFAIVNIYGYTLIKNFIRKSI